MDDVGPPFSLEDLDRIRYGTRPEYGGDGNPTGKQVRHSLTSTALANHLVATMDALRLALTFVPPWAQSAPPGLCATMYGTGTQAGDQYVVDQVKAARARLPSLNPPASSSCAPPTS